MSTPVLTSSYLKSMSELPPRELAATLAESPHHYTILLEEHRRLRDQVGVMNELALVRSLLHEAVEVLQRLVGRSDRPSLSAPEIAAVADAMEAFLRDKARVTVATMIGLRRDGDTLRVLFNDGVTDRVAIELPLHVTLDRDDATFIHVDQWVWPAGMGKAPLDPLRRGHGKEPG